MRFALPSAALIALLASASPALAQYDAAAARAPGSRNQSGSLNYAPRPGVFLVVAVDEYHRVLRLRTRYGTEADVHVDDRVHDVSTLKPGDLVQVDFFVPGEPDDRLSAATIWPLR